MLTPNFIKPFDIEEVRNEIIEEFKQKSNKLDYIPLVGDDYITLIDIFLYKLSKFIEATNIKIANNYINFSTGNYLDELVALIGMKRHEEVKPIAKVEIKVSSPTFLPKGTKFTDGKGHFAYLLEDANISDVCVVKIEANEYFKENYETTTLEINNIYVKEITMTEPFSGFKARESDEELKERFKLALHSFSTAGSFKAYKYFVLSVEGIKKANVYQASAGIVQIVYFSEFDLDTAVNKIKEAFSEKIPLTDQVLIKPATKINLNLNIEITLNQDFMFSEVLKNATSKIKDYFGSLEIGFTPHVSKIIDIAFDENVRSVEIKSQIPNINQDSILILENLQITKVLNA
ncbi:baseplate J/gp47 family protein [Campylobacter hyointestinalis]|uniref:baseplate J/gp47 family protein n=1 Tax=Campylobacter hyointestinalis TaxID=198 RepID=UPI00072C4A67|nr:baseplate J/gp47 family protein [Campylobacter hyointestinalis]PPB63098.1 phage baseplate protein [Campylobacter hyointestinalis subsp. hyointestinalis]PPB65368.1 phage baseplate protein [Campylobacter hyointestinalis subsp. hyointestinalis]CUU72203.1 baseplate assembly protein J [Campylobacter hyointestinalis subsp. hyointestinalis]